MFPDLFRLRKEQKVHHFTSLHSTIALSLSFSRRARSTQLEFLCVYKAGNTYLYESRELAFKLDSMVTCAVLHAYKQTHTHTHAHTQAHSHLHMCCIVCRRLRDSNWRTTLSIRSVCKCLHSTCIFTKPFFSFLLSFFSFHSSLAMALQLFTIVVRISSFFFANTSSIIITSTTTVSTFGGWFSCRLLLLLLLWLSRFIFLFVAFFLLKNILSLYYVNMTFSFDSLYTL